MFVQGDAWGAEGDLGFGEGRQVPFPLPFLPFVGSTIWAHMCIVISENLTETYLIVVISILFSGKPFIRCFQNHCNTLALNAYPLAGSHLSMIP